MVLIYFYRRGCVDTVRRTGINWLLLETLPITIRLWVLSYILLVVVLLASLSKELLLLKVLLRVVHATVTAIVFVGPSTVLAQPAHLRIVLHAPVETTHDCVAKLLQVLRVSGIELSWHLCRLLKCCLSRLLGLRACDTLFPSGSTSSSSTHSCGGRG